MKPALLLVGTVLAIAYFASRKKEEEIVQQQKQVPQTMQALDNLLRQAAQ